jgi:hypothetical protein
MGRSNRWKRIKKSDATLQRSLGVLAAAALLSGTAQARIGEPGAEIRARYGDPIGILPSSAEAGLTKYYLSGGYFIAVTYVDGRSAREMLAKADKTKITDKEIHLLLDANAGGSSWNVQQVDAQESLPASLLVWRTVDQRSRVAFYDSRTQAFFVTTQHFINLTNATNHRAMARVKRGGPLPGGSGERLTRSVKSANAAAVLRDHQPLPSPSPARK